MSLSNDELNAAKFGKILLNYGSDALRNQTSELIIKKLAYPDIKSFFDLNFIDIQQNQNFEWFKCIYRQLVDSNGNKKVVDNLNVFDISAICSIINNILLDTHFPNNSPNNKKDELRKNAFQEFKRKKDKCNKIRDLRNKFYGHLALFEISNGDFDSNISILTDSILFLCDDVSQKTEVKKQIDEICAIKPENRAQIELIRAECLGQLMQSRDDFQKFLNLIMTNIDKSRDETLTEMRTHLNQFIIQISSQVDVASDQVFAEFSRLTLEIRSSQNDLTSSILNEFSVLGNQMSLQLAEAVEEINSGTQQAVSTIRTEIEKLSDRLKVIEINSTQLEIDFSDENFDDYCYKILVLTERDHTLFRNHELGDTLSRFAWNAIIDLDSSCEEETAGLTQLVTQRFWDLHKSEINFRLLEDIDSGSKWYEPNIYVLGNGSNRRVNKIRNITPSKFSQKMTEFFETVIRKNVDKKIRITELFLKNDMPEKQAEQLRVIIKCCLDASADLDSRTLNEVYAISSKSFNVQRLNQILDNLNTTKCVVCRDDLIHIGSTLASIKVKSESKSRLRQLPRKRKDPKVIDERVFSVYRDCVEIYDMNCGQDVDVNEETIRREAVQFLSGEKQLTPETIFLDSHSKIFVRRSLKMGDENSGSSIKKNQKSKKSVEGTFEMIEKKIQQKINSQLVDSFQDSNAWDSVFVDYIFRILHEPSAGGTTVGRLLLHSFRRHVPCLHVLKLTDYKKVVDAIVFVSGEVERELPVLILFDNPIGSSGISDDYENLVYELKNVRKLRTIIIYLERVALLPDSYKTNEYGVSSEATKREQVFFRELRDKYEDKERLKLIGKALPDAKRVYLFGLVTFDKLYQERIESMISNHLKDSDLCDDTVKMIFLLASVCYKYTNQSMSLVMIAFLFGLSPESVGRFYGHKYSQKSDNTINSVIIKKLEEMKINELEANKKLAILDHYLGSDETGLRPYTYMIGQCLIKGVSGVLGEFRKTFDEFLKLRKFIFFEYESNQLNAGQIFVDEVGKLGDLLFAYLNKNESNGKSDSDANENFFSRFLREAQANLENRIESAEIADYLGQIYNKFKVLKVMRSNETCFGLNIGLVYARFVCFECENNLKNKEKAMAVMREVLEIEKSVRERIETFREVVFSRALATYANIRRHNLNIIYGQFKCAGFDKKAKDDKLHNFLAHVDEIVLACRKSSQLNSNNPVPLHVEVKIRVKALAFFYHEYCDKQRETYTTEIEKRIAPPVICESEQIIQHKIGLLEQLRHKKIYHNTEIWAVLHKIYTFRKEIDLRKDLAKRPFSLNVFLYISKGKQKWANLDKEKLIDLIESCKTLVKTRYKIPSNYQDLLMGYIFAQRFNLTQYHLDDALLYAKEWLDWSKRTGDNNNYDSFFLNQNSKYVANYFYALLSLLKSLGSDGAQKEEHLEIALTNYELAQKHLGEFYLNRQFQFYLTIDNGLKALKPRLLYCYRENREGELIALEDEDFRIFHGFLEYENQSSNRFNNPYWAYILETKKTNNIAFKALYNKNMAKSDLPSNMRNKEEYQFGLMIKTDNIFMINPRRYNQAWIPK